RSTPHKDSYVNQMQGRTDHQRMAGMPAQRAHPELLPKGQQPATGPHGEAPESNRAGRLAELRPVAGRGRSGSDLASPDDRRRQESLRILPEDRLRKSESGH